MPSLHFATSVTAAHVLQRHGSRRGRARLGLRGHARARARLPRRALRRRPRRRAGAGRGHPRGDAAGRARAAARLGRTLQELEAKARACMTTRAGADGRTRPPGDDEHDDDDRGLEFSGRTRPDAVRLPRRDDPRRSTCCCRSSPGLEDTWSRIEDGSPVWIVLAFAVHARHVRRLRRDVPRRLRRTVERRIGWRESYLITMAGLAATRIFAAGGAGGLVLQAWALRAGRAARSATWPTRRSRSSSLTYFPYAAAVVHLRRRPAPRRLPRRGAVHDDRGPGRDRRDPDGLASLILLVPTDLQRRLRRVRAAHRAGRPDRAEARDDPGGDLGRPARRDRRTCARSDPALLGAVAVLGLPDRGAVGRVPARSATRRRSRC